MSLLSRDWIRTNRLSIGPYGFNWNGRRWTISLKSPCWPVWFSERYGYRKPRLKIGRWRLFVERVVPA